MLNLKNEISSKKTARRPYQQGVEHSSCEYDLDQQRDLLSRKIEDRYRSFFENIQQAYFEIDKAGNFSFFNDHLCEILGYTNEELLGKNLAQFLDKEDSERVKAAFREIFETDQPKNGLVFQVIRKDGVKRQIGTTVCLDMDMMNRKIGLKGIARDISERKNLEDQINQTRRLESIGQLASGIAHEINTPIQYISDNVQFLKDSFGNIVSLLNGFLNFVQIAKTGPVSDSDISEIENKIQDSDSEYFMEEIPKAIEQSVEGLQRVLGIVSAMKQFCHPGVEDKQPADLNKAIKNIIIVARNEWKYVAEVITDLDATLPSVFCRIGEINQVLLNLIINAAHAIRDVVARGENGKGTIRVTTGHNDSWAEIRVSDTGTGIPKEIRPKIFNPFFTTKEVGKGTGQGLAISHSLVVNNHGGTLDFETESGKGTTMMVRLPLRGEDE